MIIVILSSIIYSVIWAVVCYKVAINKGVENSNWGIWGFLFGIFAFLVLISKPHNINEEINKPVKDSFDSIIKYDESIKYHARNQFIEACPLLIEDIILFNDKQKYFVNLVFKDIGKFNIKAVDINLKVYDVFDELLEEVHNIQYTSLKFDINRVNKNNIFIPISNLNSTKVKIILNKILYENSNVIEYNKEYKNIININELNWKKENIEFLKESQQKYGFSEICNIKYDYYEKSTYWICCCGQLNLHDEENCVNCNTNKGVLIKYIDESFVQSLAKKHADLQKRELEEQLRIREENRKQEEILRKSENKRILIGFCFIAVLIAAIVSYTQVISPSIKYREALLLVDNKDYSKAIIIFDELGNYKDSIEKAKDIKYLEAINLISKEQYVKAISLFEELGDYKDSEKQVLEIKYSIAVSHKDNEEYSKAYSLFIEILDFKDASEQAKNSKFQLAMYYYNNEDYEKAIPILVDLDDYNNSSTKAKEIIYSIAVSAKDAKEYGKAASTFKSLGDYKDSNEQLEEIIKSRGEYYQPRVSTGYRNLVRVNPNGTVTLYGEDCSDYAQSDLSNWTDIISVCATLNHVVGLKSDGTVIAVGEDGSSEIQVEHWSDIIAISAGHSETIGLKSNGKVIATDTSLRNGYLDVQHWSDIIDIDTDGASSTIGLRSDGTVVVAGNSLWEKNNVEDWLDIIAVHSAGVWNIGLKADGTVIATGFNLDGQCNTGSWQNIIAISAGEDHTIGLKADGTVVAVGSNKHGECDVREWNNICAIIGEGYSTVGITVDGEIIVAGLSLY